MITLSLCIVFGSLVLAGLVILGLPLVILAAILPRLLTIAAVLLFIKALLDKPVCVENFFPVAAALAMSALLRWIF